MLDILFGGKNILDWLRYDLLNLFFEILCKLDDPNYHLVEYFYIHSKSSINYNNIKYFFIKAKINFVEIDLSDVKLNILNYLLNIIFDLEKYEELHEFSKIILSLSNNNPN